MDASQYRGCGRGSSGKLLKDRYGFHVTLLKDTTRKDILKALNEYRKALTERDHLLIYYAGHGFLSLRSIEATGFDRRRSARQFGLGRVPDTDRSSPTHSCSTGARGCRFLLCRKLTRSTIGQLAADLPEQTRSTLLQELATRKIRTALTSGGAKPVLDDGGEGHSVFATAFTNVLKENTGPLETERLFWAVRSRVVQAAERMKFEQVPTYAPIHMAGHEGFGDFVFIPVSAR
jgi:hypothetical protein